VKTRRATCLVAFFLFGWLFLKNLLSLKPYWQPDAYHSPEGIVFLLPLLFIFGGITLTALYGAWRSHRALAGDLAPSRGWAAALESLVWVVFGFALMGLAAAVLVFAIGTLSAYLILFYALATALGIAGVAAFALAFRAARRSKLTPYRSELE